MQALVSLLDSQHHRQVVQLISELSEHCRLDPVPGPRPVPHLSYHVAQSYPNQPLRASLRDIAHQMNSFSVRTAGLGLFTGENPILYIPVIRSPALSKLQDQLYQSVLPLAEGASPLYEPERWVPHITVGYGLIPANRITQAVRFLQGRRFDWELRLDNLGLLYADDGRKGARFRINFN